MKILVASSAKKYSAVWRYACEISTYFRKKHKVTWLDLYDENKISRTKKLFSGIRENYDVAIMASPLLARLADREKIKLNIIIVHDIYPVSSGRGSGFAVRILARSIYRKAADADVLLFVSNFSREEFMKHYNYTGRQYVLPGGIDHAVFKTGNPKGKIRKKYGIPEEKFLVCHVGADDYRKNFNFVAEVFKKLLSKGIDAHLVKVGNLKNPINLPKDKITLIESVNDKELAEIYQMSDALLFPSLHEGLGLPPIEAMACGCPALVSDKAALPEVGLPECVINLDAGKWAEKLARIKNDTQYRKLLARKGIEKSKRFDWKTYCASLEKIIEKELKALKFAPVN